MKNGRFIIGFLPILLAGACDNAPVEFRQTSPASTGTYAREFSDNIRTRAAGAWSAPLLLNRQALSPTQVRLKSTLSPLNDFSVVQWRVQTGLQIIASGIPLFSEYTVVAIDDADNITQANPIPSSQQAGATNLQLHYQRDMARLQAIWQANNQIYRSTSLDSLGNAWSTAELLGSGFLPQLLLSPRQLAPTVPDSLQELSFFWQDVETLLHQGQFLAAGMGGSPLTSSQIERLNRPYQIGQAMIDNNNRTTVFTEETDASGMVQVSAHQIEPGKKWRNFTPRTLLDPFDQSIQPLFSAALDHDVFMLIGMDRQANVLAQLYHPVFGWQQAHVISEPENFAVSREELQVTYNGRNAVQVAWISSRLPQTNGVVYANRFTIDGPEPGWQGVHALNTGAQSIQARGLSVAMANNGNTAVLWFGYDPISSTGQLLLSEFTNQQMWIDPLQLFAVSPTTVATSVAVNDSGLVHAIWAEFVSTTAGQQLEIRFSKRL